MKQLQRVFVAGHNGMVGSALIRKLKEVATVELIVKNRDELNLTNQREVSDFFRDYNIDQVYLAAAKVGGIVANDSYPADFLYENLQIASNVIHSAHIAKVKKLLFLGSSCIYPKFAEQPLKEEYLLSGKLEPTNEPYAIAKIAGIKMCESYKRQYGCDFRSVMPSNLYGQNDNFHPLNSHVIPALIRRFHNAKVNNEKEVVAWGSGNPMREFLHVDDMADACLHVMDIPIHVYDNHTGVMLNHINVGTGQDCTIRQLVETIANVIGYNGRIEFDTSKPDGAPRKLMDSNKLQSLGWQSTISLRQGLQSTYKWFTEHQHQYRN